MSRLAPAIRLRRRQLDGLALAIAGERQRSDALAAAAAELRQRRTSERLLAAVATLPSDPWFAAAARHLGRLGDEQSACEQRLADLRHDAVRARARLTLLEDAERAARAAEGRDRERKVQAMLDDRTAALWTTRP